MPGLLRAVARTAVVAGAADQATWGLFQVPERDLGVLRDFGGLDVLELAAARPMDP
jgi:hypothetical protein